LRPSAVAIRARKPWVRARLSLLGWKVRFMAYSEGNMDKKVGKYGGDLSRLSNACPAQAVDIHVDIHAACLWRQLLD